MELESIMLSEISQAEKDKYQMYFHSYVEYKNKGKLKEQNSSRITEPRNGLTVSKGIETGENGRVWRNKGGEEERGYYD